jgi:hypothetical protein
LNLSTQIITPKIKSVIILTSVLVISFHTLIFIQTFGVNVLAADDLFFVPLVEDVVNNEAFWENEVFIEFRDQRPIFPNLILILNVVFLSWNSMFQFYFGWLLIVLSIIPMYILLKNIDKRLTWLIIPIAAFLFNPAQHVSLLMDIASRQMVFTLFAITFSIYFLNKPQLTKYSFTLAIIFGIIASFSAIPGLSIWIVGLLSFVYQKINRKKILISWTCIGIIVFALYFSNYEYGKENIALEPLEFFSENSLKLFFMSVSNGLLPNITPLVSIQVLIGLFISTIILTGSLHLRFKIKNKATIPWIQFGLLGIMYAGMSTIARVILPAPLSHYVTISELTYVSALVISSIIFLQIYNQTKNKKIVLSIFIIFIIIISGSLIGSYSKGWYDGVAYNKEMKSLLDCTTNPLLNFDCGRTEHQIDVFNENGPILEKMKMGPFATDKESRFYFQDPLLVDKNWDHLEKDLVVYGEIEYIDDIKFESDLSIKEKKMDNLIEISGWSVISKKHKDLDSANELRNIFGINDKNPMPDAVYVFIDNQFNSKVNYGKLRDDISNKFLEISQRNSGWNGVIDLQNLSNECHDLSIRVVLGEHYNEIKNDSQICR